MKILTERYYSAEAIYEACKVHDLPCFVYRRVFDEEYEKVEPNGEWNDDFVCLKDDLYPSEFNPWTPEDFLQYEDTMAEIVQRLGQYAGDVRYIEIPDGIEFEIVRDGGEVLGIAEKGFWWPSKDGVIDGVRGRVMAIDNYDGLIGLVDPDHWWDEEKRGVGQIEPRPKVARAPRMVPRGTYVTISFSSADVTLSVAEAKARFPRLTDKHIARSRGIVDGDGQFYWLTGAREE